MAKNARFYILTEQSSRGTEQLACDLAASAWRLGKRVLIACETERQALDIDEALWQRDPDEFVPHNLSGEATQYVTRFVDLFAARVARVYSRFYSTD